MTPTPEADAGESIDLREIFLARAAARLLLYEAGAMTLDEAINGLAPAFRHIIGLADCKNPATNTATGQANDEHLHEQC